MKDIAIIGAGVIGLSTGIELLAQGYTVTIFSKAITPHTTSDIAAAIWSVYRAQPEHKTTPWSLATLQRFKQLALATPEAGIMFKLYTDLHATCTSKNASFNYLEEVPCPGYLPKIYQKHSHSVNLPLIDTQLYMPYLHRRFIAESGEIHIATITKIAELFNDFRIVINCSGLGAKDLVNDDAVYPIRGHVLSIKKIPDFDDCMVMSTDSELVHIMSRTNDCLLGGTVDEHNWDNQPCATIRDTIIARAKEIYPPLADQPMTILKEMVGLRPGRSAVRLEIERYNDDQVVIHNYGHGGSGYTLSWGCAQDVAALVAECS